jgi:dTDP-L-rhamnose 4-epimerase
MHILVTGGAGFHRFSLVEALVARGHDVVIYDTLDPQVHGDPRIEDLDSNAKFVGGDVRDYDVEEMPLG